jgi:hypothetical protein
MISAKINHYQVTSTKVEEAQKKKKKKKKKKRIEQNKTVTAVSMTDYSN